MLPILLAALLFPLAQAAPPSPASSAALVISTQGNALAYDKTELSARPGETVTLRFHNRASPDSSMEHNWVLVKPGTEDKVATQGISAGRDKNYVPDSPDIIAHTRLVGPGQTDTVKFRAPTEPGEYPYMCTFPGHSKLLRGKLKVAR